VNSLAWERPDDVQVFVQDQESNRFQVWMIGDGAFRQVIDEGR
jgi:hypothetical protein